MANGNGNQITKNGSKALSRKKTVAAKDAALEERKEAREREAAARKELDQPIAESGASRIPLAQIEVDPMLNVSRFYIDEKQAAEMREKEFASDDFKSLLGTMQRQGQLNPVIIEINPNKGKTSGRSKVVKNPGAPFRLRAGFRRTEAATQLEWDTVAAKIVSGNDRALDEINHVENSIRKDVTTFQRAASFANHKAKYQLTDAEVARVFGKTESYVSNQIRCYKNLHPTIQRAWSERDKEANKAVYLATWSDLLIDYAKLPQENQLAAFQYQLHLAGGKSPAQAKELVEKEGFVFGEKDKRGSKDPKAGAVTKATTKQLQRALAWFDSKVVRQAQGEEECLRMVAVLNFALGHNPNVRVGKEIYFDPRDPEMGGEEEKPGK